MNLKRLAKRLLHVPDADEWQVAEPQGEEEAKLAKYILDEFERRKEERRPFELQWRLNQNFVAGNQYCDIDAVTGDLDAVEPVYDWMCAEVYNQLAPIVSTRLAKLGRVQPGLSVRPATQDDEDLAAAKASSQILKGMAVAHNLNHILRDCEAWCEICGTALLKSVWNPHAGRVIGMVDGQTVREGDLEVTVVPAYEFYPDSVTRASIEDCESVIHARAYTVGEIYSRWGVRIPGRRVDVFSLDNTGLVAGGTGYNPGYRTVQKGELDDAEIVLEWMERPSPEYPEGRMAIVAGDRLIHLSALPWRVGEYGERGLPYARMICEANPGYFFGTSVVERCIPIQRAYNAVENRIHEYLARSTIGVLIAEQGSIVNDEVLEDGVPPGSVLEVRGGATVPQWMESPPIPQALLAERENLDNQFILISGTSEISRNSNVPSSSMSGVALELLKEQDDTRLSSTAESVRDMARETGVIWLRLLRQYVTTARVTRLVGENNEMEMRLWRGSELTSDDVVIDTDNELSNTPAQRRNTALELFKAGLFTDPDTGRLTRSGRMQMMTAFDLGNWEDITSLDELMREQARRENDEVERGEELRVNELDDTEIHLLEHTRYVFSARYREMERDRPDLARKMMDHIREHQSVRQAQAAQSMQAQNAGVEEAARQKLALEAMMTQGGTENAGNAE